MAERTIRNLLFIFFLTTLLTASLATEAQKAPDRRKLRETMVVRVVRRVAPCVVYISCEHRVRNPFAGSIWDFFNDDFGSSGGRIENSLGSGFIVDHRGFILTNEHVILNGSNIRVTLKDGKEYPATVVGAAPEMDLALLKIKADRELPSVSLGRSDDLMIGETVIAVGNPFGLSNTVTVGVLSATGRTIHSEEREYSDFLQTDAPINPGNSGGPLLNILGEVIGVNTAIIQHAQGIGFAIPVNRAKLAMKQLMTYGKVKHVWVGFLPVDPSESYRRESGRKNGFFVGKTYPYIYPQDHLKQGDFITEVNGKPVHGTGDFNAVLATTPPGGVLKVKGFRDKIRVSAVLKVKTLPGRLTAPMVWQLFGIRITNDYGMVLVKEVRRGSPAAAVGLRSGDGILSVGQTRVKNRAAFLIASAQALRSSGLLLSVARGGWTYYVTLNLLD